MRIEYQRNLKNSYMVVIEEDQTLNPDGQLAEKMMKHRQISQLLSWVSMEHEKDMTFWYQITGLQSLSECLQQRSLDYELLGRLLSALLALQEELPRCYLKPEHLLLREELIFFDLSTHQARFCYDPLWRGEPRESLRGLLEQLLSKVDHADKYAVRLAYGLYEKCQEQNADVWAYVLGELNAPEEPAQESRTEPSAEPQFRSSVYAEEPVPVPPEQEPVVQTAEHKVLLRHSSPLAWLQSVRKGRTQTQKPQPMYLFEPEEAPVLSEHPTVYLGEGKTTEGRLAYQGNGAEKSYVIQEDEFLIGARNEHADAKLQASGVSRSHARITREQDAYYIEDLNSRNGTYVNDELLSYRQRQKLNSGDRLRFAREEFIFY